MSLKHPSSTQTFSQWPVFSEREIERVAEVMRSNKVNYWTGEEGKSFEKEFCAYFGSEYALCMANGTLALEGALEALGVGTGDEVVVTPRTYMASASAIRRLNAIPVFADISRDSQNITGATVGKVLTPKTKAIIAVHLAGWPCDMPGIMALAREHGIYVIEDCAQAHGATIDGKSVGTFGHVSAWSFCQDKIMTTGGEGGMVTTQDESLWESIWSLRDHGKCRKAMNTKPTNDGFRWLVTSFGSNWRMTEMQSAIGRIQLETLSDWTAKRNRNANAIWQAARDIPGLRVPTVPNNIQHAAYKCYVFVEPEKLASNWSRDRIMAEVAKLGVPCLSGSCPELYLEKAFDKGPGRPKERLPVASELGETSLMFLVHPTLTQEDLERTISALNTVMKSAVEQAAVAPEAKQQALQT